MTDSFQRPPSENAPSKVRQRLAKYKKNEISEATQLPPWVKVALTYRELYGWTWKDICKTVKRSPVTLQHYRRSPAAKAWVQSVREFRDDPVKLAGAILKSNQVGVMLDRVVFLEAAKEAGDYKEGDKIARDMQDRAGLVRKTDQPTGPAQIVINLPGGASIEDIPMVESEIVEIND